MSAVKHRTRLKLGNQKFPFWEFHQLLRLFVLYQVTRLTPMPDFVTDVSGSFPQKFWEIHHKM